jgi:hypothetical protein
METPTPLQAHAPGKRQLIILLLVGLIVVGLAGLLACLIMRPHGCSGVGDVWKNARNLEGQRICVEGKASAYISQSLQLCDPPRCDCNQSFAFLSLVSEDKIVRNPRVNIVDEVVIDKPSCSGDECTITCSPFNPFAADRFQFFGKLSINYLSDGRMARLSLTDLDLSASRQLVGGTWQPIPTGTFTNPTH